jgi:transposase
VGHVGNRRKIEISDDEIIQLYRDTLSVNKVSKKTGLSTQTIYRAMDRAGVPRVGLAHYRQNATKFDRLTEAEIRRRYEAGEYYAQLVEVFGGTEYSIKRAIERAGGRLVPVTPPLTDAERDRILALRREGVSQFKIADLVEKSQSTVSRFLRSEGEVFEPRRGERHGMWRGGRIVDSNGYVRVWLGPEDEFAGMRLNDGYVLEHRLVVARKLGRALRRSETVHHIDGDPTNNDPNNLQLRQGKHGHHVVFVCTDCGSHNVSPAPLAGE